VIKIDVEGFELNVLRGARLTLEKHRPLLFLEINPEALDSVGAQAAELTWLLKYQGYAHFCYFRTPSSQVPVDALDFESHQDLLLPPK